jgi:hypothetical protein
MVGTLEALLVVLVAVLPGAVYTIALENRGAGWVWPRSDTGSQIIRFIGASAVFHAIFAPVTYWAYQHLIVTRALSSGTHVELYWWPILLGYLLIPYAWGEITIRARRSSDDDSCLLMRTLKRFVGLYAASAPEPRAWDWFFSKPGLKGTVRLQLTTGEWKVGYWGDSYASSYVEDGDLYMAVQYALDDEDGALVLDDSGDMQPLGTGLLIRWSEVRYLEFRDETGDNESGGT